MESVIEIVAFACLDKDDVLYDLGCGDGRICMTASLKHNITTVGVEIEEGAQRHQ